MSLTSNGSTHGVKTRAKPAISPSSGSVSGTEVTFQTAEGTKMQGLPVRIARHAIVFELLSPVTALLLSEALREFKLVLQGRTLYSGRAVVRNLIEAGAKTVCEATLDTAEWLVDADLASMGAEHFASEFKVFLREWEKFSTIAPEFKVITTDLTAFLIELKCWLDKVELNTGVATEPLRTRLHTEALQQAAPAIIRAIDAFIERFESFTAALADEEHPRYQSHLRRYLHPLLLVSPFARRAYTKPLGYAGDYGMVNMMLNPVAEGETLYAKLLNVWLLGQAPAQAHRNRVALLEKQLIEEAMRVRNRGAGARILNLGCGPAVEVQRFIKTHPVHAGADFTLVDFNEETLDYVNRCFTSLRRQSQHSARIHLVKRSVLQILRDRGRSLIHSGRVGYDYIYCAGLFDYLQKDVCKQVLTIFYEMLLPGGLLLATNATEKLNSSKPFRFSMEYFLDWHLIYRDREQFLQVVPDEASPDQVVISMEETGVNLFLKIRKPDDAIGG